MDGMPVVKVAGMSAQAGILIKNGFYPAANRRSYLWACVLRSTNLVAKLAEATHLLFTLMAV